MKVCRPTRLFFWLVLGIVSTTLLSASRAVEPIQVGFLWHMHQPRYIPGETIFGADSHFSFSVPDVHHQRHGPYTSWPKDAIAAGLGMSHLGASVSFSGSLIENLNELEAAGVNGGMWNNWDASYRQARQWNTSEGNSRLDMIGFGYHHPLMPLLDERDMRMQIKLHKQAVAQAFGSDVPYSKGIFPAETAFSERMIPALVAEGLEWSLVDNIHFDRASQNYPHTNGSGLFQPNPADQINPDPTAGGGAWVQLNNVWAPSQVSAPFSYRPHNVQHIDPNTGAVSQMVAVPAARYEGNEDGRGGYGAFLYDQVMDQYIQHNTDPDHPMFVVLHHDGDNFGGGSDAYYHHNFQNMVNWASNDQDYDVTTIQDYLDRFPVAADDVIHVEPGSWAGADNGDAEFKKWLGDPNSSGWSPDRNSWAVLTAAKNRVFTAHDIQLGGADPNLQNVMNGTGNATERAWHFLLQAESSDHWYWDGTEVWDSNVTRGSNLAVAQADEVLGAGTYGGAESTGPTLFLPQRESYNPGGFEWNDVPEPSDFEVWTFAYDVSGLSSVTLKYRVDDDGVNPLSSAENETYVGGSEVGVWQSVTMTPSDISPPGNILSPAYRALRFGAMIEGHENVLLDYYVEATDLRGNITRSDIQHVYVGEGNSTSGFVMDGQLDAAANEVAVGGGHHLYLALQGEDLYVATEDAHEGNDVFIYLAEQPGQLVDANWAKTGQVAQWDAYLGEENDNDWEGWFDAAGATGAESGSGSGVLEGVISLIDEFGQMPDEIYLAVGIFETQDGGALLPDLQVPGSVNGDGNLDSIEYLRFQIIGIAPGDFDADGDVDGDDFLVWQAHFGGSGPDGDADNDGDVDGEDFLLWQSNFGPGGGTGAWGYRLMQVPEPASFVFALLLAVVLLSRSRRRRS